MCVTGRRQFIYLHDILNFWGILILKKKLEWSEMSSHDSMHRFEVIDNRCRKSEAESADKNQVEFRGKREYNNEHTFKHPWLPYMQARGKLRNETRQVTAKQVRRIRQENEREDRCVPESFVSVSAASDCPAELEIVLWEIVVDIVAYSRSF